MSGRQERWLASRTLFALVLMQHTFKRAVSRAESITPCFAGSGMTPSRLQLPRIRTSTPHSPLPGSSSRGTASGDVALAGFSSALPPIEQQKEAGYKDGYVVAPEQVMLSRTLESYRCLHQPRVLSAFGRHANLPRGIPASWTTRRIENVEALWG